MTKAFCHLILHYSIARLSWKTIKSLRRTRSQCQLQRNNKRLSASAGNERDYNDGNDNGCNHAPHKSPKSTPSTPGRSPGRKPIYDNDAVSPVEYEILQGWTLLAFHSLFVAMRIEYAVAFVIPFYYHLKMVVLIATFVIPSWAVARAGGRVGGNDGGGGQQQQIKDSSSEFGLSPAISFWFDYLIVPGVHKAHELMDHDPKRWAKHQLAMLPFVVVNYFILPGVLLTEEERMAVRKARREEILRENEDDYDNTPHLEDEALSKFPPSGAFPPDVSFDQKHLASSEENGALEVVDENSTEKYARLRSLKDNLNNLDVLMEIIDTSDNACNQTSPTRKRGDKLLLDNSQSSNGNKISHQTPPRRKKSTTLSNSPHSPDNIRSALLSQTAPTTYNSPKTSSRKSSYSLTFSPVAKSRVASSALRLRRFSKEHQIIGSLWNSNKKRSKDDNDDSKKCHDWDMVENDVNTPVRKTDGMKDSIGISTGVSRVDAKNKYGQQLPSLATASMSSLSNSSTEQPKIVRKRRERLSLGDHLREFVTGDANIRVRDHLFDLDLPSVPVPSPARMHHLTPRDGNHRCANSKGDSVEELPLSSSRRQRMDIDESEVIDHCDSRMSFVTTRRSTRLAKARAARASH